jgi:radical SAM protein with 4Fe4S-binding SPASM domain
MTTTEIPTAPATARKNELTAIVHREKFEELPGDIHPHSADAARWRRFRDRYGKAQKLDFVDTFPLQIDFELNSTCNLRCAFCIHGQGKVERRSLTFDDFRRVIEEGELHGLCSIKLNYINEPMLNRDLAEYVRFAKEHGVLNVYFATNGTLLTKERGLELITARLTKIMISIDAATHETYKTMRGSDHYTRIVENIENFVALRRSLGVSYPVVRVNFLKTRLNIHEIEAFAERWDGIADAIGFQEQVALPGVDDDELLNGMRSEEKFRCSFPFKLVVIDSAGHILPCCTFSGREMPIGDIRTGTVGEAWRSERMVELRRIHRESLWESNPVCRHCIKGR